MNSLSLYNNPMGTEVASHLLYRNRNYESEKESNSPKVTLKWHDRDSNSGCVLVLHCYVTNHHKLTGLNKILLPDPVSQRSGLGVVKFSAQDLTEWDQGVGWTVFYPVTLGKITGCWQNPFHCDWRTEVPIVLLAVSLVPPSASRGHSQIFAMCYLPPQQQRNPPKRSTSDIWEVYKSHWGFWRKKCFSHFKIQVFWDETKKQLLLWLLLVSSCTDSRDKRDILFLWAEILAKYLSWNLPNSFEPLRLLCSGENVMVLVRMG